MRKSIFLLLFLAFVAKNEVFSQAKINVDSLVAYNDKYLKEDTVKIDMLILISRLYRPIDVQKTLEYMDRAVIMSENIQNVFYMGRTNGTKAEFYFRTGDLKESKIYCSKARHYFEKSKSYHYFGSATMLMGSILARLSDFDNAIKYYDEAITIFDKTKNDGMKSRVITGLATIYKSLGNFEKSIEYYNLAIKLNEKIDDKDALLLAYSNIPDLYILQGNYLKGIEYAQKTRSLAESLGNLNIEASAYTNIGVAYFNLNSLKEAHKYFSKALEIFKKLNDKLAIANLMINVVNAQGEDDIPKSIEEYKKAIAYCKDVDDKASLAIANHSISEKYKKIKNYTLSYAHAQEALSIEKETKDIRNTLLINVTLADLLIECSDNELVSFNIDPKKRYEIAKNYLNNNFEIAPNSHPLEMQMTWGQLSKIYEKQGDYIKAYDAFKKHIAIKDSISSDDVKKQFTRKEIQYEYDKKETVLKYEQQLTTEQLEKQRLLTFQQGQTLTLKEQALLLSNKEKDLAHLAYLKEQAEKQEKTQQLSLSEEREKGKEKDLTLKNLELSAQQKQNLYLGLFSILLLGGLGTLLYFYNTLKKQKTIITQQNELNEHTIAILSHDIKEPLLGVKLMLKKLNKDDPFVAQASQSLENQINSVNGILTNLLKMKKLSFAKKDKNVKANVKSVVQNVIQELNVAIQGKSLNINNELTDDLMIPIVPEKLQIIVNNLLSNAVKYSFPNQSIRIFQEDNGFCIQDFGIGLSPEQRSKVMREVTASQQGTSQERGNGMGLFLVGAMLQGEQIKVIFDSPEVGGTIVKVLG